MSTPHDFARRHLRHHLKAGALQVQPTAPLVRSAMNLLEAADLTHQLNGCEHIVAAEDTGTMPAALLAMHGPDAWQLRCPDCFTLPPRCCQVCERALAPKVRRVVAVVDGHGLVLLGALCADCRPGRVA